jgi:hypothetical protein
MARAGQAKSSAFKRRPINVGWTIAQPYGTQSQLGDFLAIAARR